MVVIFCPKCGGGTYIQEEDLVRILENTRPLKAVLKILYVCRACADKFSRLVNEDLETKKRDTSGTGVANQQTQAPTRSVAEAAESLKFF